LRDISRPACGKSQRGIFLKIQDLTRLPNAARAENTYDREGVADVIYQTFSMGDAEVRRRMRRLRSILRRLDSRQ